MRTYPGRAPVLISALAIVTWAQVPVHGQDLTSTLTVEEVRCNDEQLERLLVRSGFEAARRGTLLITYGGAGLFEGLLISRREPSGPPPNEVYLAFHLDPDVRPHLLDPRRPPIAQVGLTREEEVSNLVPLSSPLTATVRVNPLQQPGAPSNSPSILRINNVQPPSPGQKPHAAHLTSDVGPGRGFDADGLRTTCHARFTPFDRWVFSLLQRMLVVTANTCQSPCLEPDEHDMEVAVFRDQDSHDYRIQAYPQAARADNRLALRLRVEWTADGQLTRGVLDGLPRCSGPQQRDCTTHIGVEEVRVFFAPPSAGRASTRPFPWNGVVFNQFLGDPDPSHLHAEIDFERLLAATTWNAGGIPAP